MSANKFGRVDENNNVFVLELGSERQVGQYPNVSPEAALAFLRTSLLILKLKFEFSNSESNKALRQAICLLNSRSCRSTSLNQKP